MDMKRLLCFLAMGMVFTVAQPARAATEDLLIQQDPPLQLPRDNLRLGNQAARRDTVWFGGDDGTGIAFEGGVWDWDTIASDPFQGWISVDETTDQRIYFARVTEQDYLDHGDPCIPIIETPGNVGQIACIIHEDEALSRDFLAGMGYQNWECQRAFSPMFDISDPSTAEISLEFKYFNYTEPGFDYVWIYVLSYDTGVELIEETRIHTLDGIHGDYMYPDSLELGPIGALHEDTEQVQIELRMHADGGWSDEDGRWDTPCGPFAADDVDLTVEGVREFYDFEDGAQGWTFDKCAGVGSFMSVVPEET